MLDLKEELELQGSATSRLADVRKSAESWRTGLAGFLAILIAVFFIRGKDSFDDIGGAGWKALLAALLLLAAASALYGAYRALRAAYGVPRDEYLGEVSGVFRLIPQSLRSTPRDIHDYGTLSAWHHAFARQAVSDLRHAKVATVGSVVAVASAAAVTWFAPGPSENSYAEVTYRVGDASRSACGKVLDSSSGTLAIERTDGRRVELPFADVLTLEPAPSCD